MDFTHIGLILLLIILVFDYLHFRGVNRWIELVNALRVYDPQTFEYFGAPTFNWLQIFDRKKLFANEHLWLEVLRSPGRFRKHPQVREAAEAFRRMAILKLLIRFGLLLIAVLILLAKK